MELGFGTFELGLGLNHTDPAEWSTPAEYKDVQKAPDYNPHLNLFVEALNGNMCAAAAVSGMMLKIESMPEFLLTHPKFRRMGFGRELVCV